MAFVSSMDGKAQLWLRSLDADDAKPLAGTDSAIFPFWSAFIGFFAGAKLKRLEIRTGTVQSICDVNPSGGGGTGLYVGTMDGPERQLVVRQEWLDVTAVQYAPPGQVVYVRNHQLVTQSFDVATFKVTGPPIPFAEGFGIGGPGRPAFGVSNNGVLGKSRLFRAMSRSLCGSA